MRIGRPCPDGPTVTGNGVAPARKAVIAASCCVSTQIAICFLPAWRILALKAACLCALVPMLESPQLLVMSRTDRKLLVTSWEITSNVSRLLTGNTGRRTGKRRKDSVPSGEFWRTSRNLALICWMKVIARRGLSWAIYPAISSRWQLNPCHGWPAGNKLLHKQHSQFIIDKRERSSVSSTMRSSKG